MIIIVTFNHENAVTGKERLDKLTVQAVSLEWGGGGGGGGNVVCVLFLKCT